MPLRLALFVALAVLAATAQGQHVLREGFEGPQIVLQPAGADATHRLTIHRTVPQDSHSGAACEQLQVTGNNGTYVLMSYPVGAPRLIDELRGSVWVKADRPGLQLLLRAVLPRSVDPQTGKPLTTLLRGSDYRQVGQWQQLHLENLPQLLKGQVRVLRTQFGPHVDPGEAYVDLALLNVYGGPGTTNVQVDDLEITGIVASSQGEAPAAPRDEPLAGQPGRIEWPGGQGVPRVEIRSRLLLVGGKPFFPRAIEHCGEPLSRLQALGFNTVWLREEPTAALLREAKGLGLWLIAPPPPPPALAASAPAIDERHDPVLAWDLGSRLAKTELEVTRRWTELIRAADPRRRPLVCAAASDVGSYTRLVDLFVARREPLGTTLPLDQFGLWLRDQSQLARGGTPLWVAIQTEPSVQAVEQARLAAPDPSLPLLLEEPQVRMLIHAALAARARGLVFASRSRLDARDSASLRRAAMLELLNLHLTLLERWPAAGSFAPTASSNDPHTVGAVIETDRSRLVLPIFQPPQAQFVLGNTSVRDLSFVVPGVPEGNNAYELSPTSLRPLASKRITGGTLVTLGEAERDSVIVFTHDERVHRVLTDRLAQTRARAVQLAFDLAASQLAETGPAVARLNAVGRSIPASDKSLGAAQGMLAEAESLRSSDLVGAYYRARKVQHAAREIRRAYWDQVRSADHWPLDDPLAAGFVTLADHVRRQDMLARLGRGPNLLAEGGFESLDAMRRAGWRYYQHPQPQIITTVDLAPEAAHDGTLGLRLRAAAADPKSRPSAIETPPLWITSPPVSVQQGDLIEIQGWARLPAPATGSVDGLLILDSLSGEPLCGRLTAPGDWRQFKIVRAAPRATSVVVTFALSGLGEAWIDGVSIQLVNRGAPAEQARLGADPTAQRPPGASP